ncbi:hypothetical protein J6590_055330 [Homalodisca vitripennis]|nr:hypothetical protein J6590_055330 [Homalodisca vitripennis]
MLSKYLRKRLVVSESSQMKKEDLQYMQFPCQRMAFLAEIYLDSFIKRDKD